MYNNPNAGIRNRKWENCKEKEPRKDTQVTPTLPVILKKNNLLKN